MVVSLFVKLQKLLMSLLFPKKSFDFLLPCNNLGHIANPLMAINNWNVPLKQNGTMVLILPRKNLNFDYRSSVATLDYLLSDYKNNITEHDLTHFDEIIQRHDLKLDSPAAFLKDLKKRSVYNYSNRCIHHHVYNLQLLDQICSYLKPKIIVKTSPFTDHIIIAKKLEYKFEYMCRNKKLIYARSLRAAGCYTS